MVPLWEALLQWIVNLWELWLAPAACSLLGWCWSSFPCLGVPRLQGWSWGRGISFSCPWGLPGTGPHVDTAMSSFLNQDSGHSWESLSVPLSRSANESLGKYLSDTCACEPGAAEPREVQTSQRARAGAAWLTTRPGSPEAGFPCLCPYTCFDCRRPFLSVWKSFCEFSCCLPKPDVSVWIAQAPEKYIHFGVPHRYHFCSPQRAMPVLLNPQRPCKLGALSPLFQKRKPRLRRVKWQGLIRTRSPG